MADTSNNVSTENQPKGSARNLSDTLDRDTAVSGKPEDQATSKSPLEDTGPPVGTANTGKSGHDQDQ
jgi:hypothetical protein